MVERYGEERGRTDPVLRERLEKEISLMEEKGFVSYFLIVREFMDWSRAQDIPLGPGRGSAAGSIVSYILGITDLCPIRFGLVFERFLNPERISPPDIDIDFCQTRRPEVIQHVREKYGERKVSHIITFGKMLAKGSIRDVGRVLGLSYGDADRISKMVPGDLGITLKEARKKNPELRAAIENEEATANVWKFATFMEGLKRNPGVHAAGVVIGADGPRRARPPDPGQGGPGPHPVRHGTPHRPGDAQDGLPRAQDPHRDPGRHRADKAPHT